MPDETTDPLRLAAEVPAIPDDVALAAAAIYGRHGYSDTGAAFAAAVGWERGWASGREAAAERLAAVESTLQEVLRHFAHKGHPGEPCLSTGWVRESTVAKWREIARGGR